MARLNELWPLLRAGVDGACARQDLALAEGLVRPIAPEVSLRRKAGIGAWAERILQLFVAEDEGRRIFWLAWAADRYAQADDEPGFDRLLQRYGTPTIR